MTNLYQKCNFISLFAVAIILLLGSCTQQSRTIDSKVLSVFSNFAFVGEGTYNPPAEQAQVVNPAVAGHGLNILPLPERLEIKKQYIFHHKPPLDVEKLAVVVLPSRLQSRA